MTLINHIYYSQLFLIFTTGTRETVKYLEGNVKANEFYRTEFDQKVNQEQGKVTNDTVYCEAIENKQININIA